METHWNATAVKQKIYPVFIVLLHVTALCREVREAVGSLVRGQGKVGTSMLTYQGVTSYLGLISKIYLQNENCHVLTALLQAVLSH